MEKRFTDKMAQLTDVNERITAQKAVLDGLQSTNSESKNGIPELKAKMQALRDQIDEKRKEISVLRNEFKKAENEYFEYAKAERARIQALKEAEAAARKAEEEARQKAM